MTTQAIILLVSFLVVLLGVSYPLGILIAKISDDQAQVPGFGWLAWLEKAIYKVGGVKTEEGMGWKSYAVALLVFNALGAVFVYVVQRVQLWLPLNPQDMANVSSDSSFNTAVSFVSNTNWQGYAGEGAMSYFTQMIALAGQNFLRYAASKTAF